MAPSVPEVVTILCSSKLVEYRQFCLMYYLGPLARKSDSACHWGDYDSDASLATSSSECSRLHRLVDELCQPGYWTAQERLHHPCSLGSCQVLPTILQAIQFGWDHYGNGLPGLMWGCWVSEHAVVEVWVLLSYVTRWVITVLSTPTCTQSCPVCRACRQLPPRASGWLAHTRPPGCRLNTTGL